MPSVSPSETVQCQFSDVMQREEANKTTAPRPNNTGIQDRLKSGLESLSGYVISSVRVYYNSPKPQELGALAYTQGANIYMGPG